MASAKCQSLTKKGEPCKGVPLPGSDFCMAHQPEVPAEGEVCGHINEHWTGADEMTCELTPGHEGPHSTIYHAIGYKEGQKIIDEDQRTYWSDEAGIPIE